MLDRLLLIGFVILLISSLSVSSCPPDDNILTDCGADVEISSDPGFEFDFFSNEVQAGDTGADIKVEGDTASVSEAASISTTTDTQVVDASDVKVKSNGDIEAREVEQVQYNSPQGGRASLETGTNVRITPTEVSADTLAFRSNGAILANAVNYLETPDLITVASAESFERDATAGTTIGETEFRKTTINSASVDTLILNNGGIAFKKLKEVKLLTDEDGSLLEIEAKSAQDNNQLAFQSRSNGLLNLNLDADEKFHLRFQGPETSLRLNRDITGDINRLAFFTTLNNDALLEAFRVGKKTTATLEQVELAIQNVNFQETVTTKNRAEVIYTDEDGYEFLNVQPGTVYTFNDSFNPEQSFALVFDDNLKIQVKKSVAQEDYSDVNGLISHIDKTVAIEGKVKFIKDNKIFETDNANNRLFIRQEGDKVSIDLSTTDFTGITTTYAGPFTIQERSGVHRFLNLQDLFFTTPNQVVRYTTDFQPSTPPILFQNNILRQRNVNVFTEQQDEVLSLLTTEPYTLYLK